MLSKWLVIITGESNSGGYALNGEALASELEPRSGVRILHNSHLRSFDPLQIGVNNLIGHSGHEPNQFLTHGFELELANRAEQLPPEAQPVYLVKTGHGGSTIAEWATDDIYFLIFLKRIRAARALLKGKALRPVILFSQGINDAIARTEIGVWKDGVKAHFGHLRHELGAETPIIMTRFMSRYAAYNAAIDELCRDTPNTYAVDTLDASLRDENHWDYLGMKRVAGRMLDLLENLDD